MQQPVLVLRPRNDVSSQLASEILICEGFPWLEVRTLDEFDAPAPEVELLILAGVGASRSDADKLAASVSNGLPFISLAPDQNIAAALGLTLGGPTVNAHLRVTGLSDWEHGDLSLLCPGDLSSPITGGNPIASFVDPDDRADGSAIVSTGPGDLATVFGYDLCKTIAHLRHGTGALDCPDENENLWGGPRALYGFWELSEHIPHNIPLADIHQDILRSLIRQYLPLSPRIWHFPDAAPSVWMVRGDGCGEEGAEIEVETVEQFDAYLTFCRPFKSRYDGALMREWHTRGHGISIEANINHITQPVTNGHRQRLTSDEINAEHLPAIRDHLEAHRDAFHSETGLEMEVFMTHSAQWTGLPMAQIVQELGWHTLQPFQSIDPRIRPGDEAGPYLIGTALPMRYWDHEAGVLDLWHVPYQWIDRIWQTVASNRSSTIEELETLIGESGEDYGEKLARFAEDAATKWHVGQVSSFHPCYVSKDWPLLGSSRRALELGLAGARTVGAQFENLENWSRFIRTRAEIRLVHSEMKDDQLRWTLESEHDIEGLTLLLPETIREIHSGPGEVRMQEKQLEGRMQNFVVLNFIANQPKTIYMRATSNA